MPIDHLPITGTNLNLATATRWVAVIPYNMINNDLNSRNVVFNLTSFNMPEMEVGTTTITYLGYEYEIPNFIRSQSKEITFEYLISSDWHQWKLLYYWLQKIVKEEGAGSNIDTLSEVVLPIRVMLLSEFKNPIFEIIYKNCWVKRFGAVSMDYQDTEGSVIKHDFTCSYSDFEFNDNF